MHLPTNLTAKKLSQRNKVTPMLGYKCTNVYCHYIQGGKKCKDKCPSIEKLLKIKLKLIYTFKNYPYIEMNK